MHFNAQDTYKPGWEPLDPWHLGPDASVTESVSGGGCQQSPLASARWVSVALLPT